MIAKRLFSLRLLRLVIIFLLVALAYMVSAQMEYITETFRSFLVELRRSYTAFLPYCGSQRQPGARPNDTYDLKHYGPYQFLANYRNPCWRSSVLGGNISCLPYFWLIGFPKSGTTDLYMRLTAHPQILVARKELHWLTRSWFEGVSFNAYLALHSKDVRNVIISSEGNSSPRFHPKIFGDASASTAWDNLRWQRLPGNQNCTQPSQSPATWIRHVTPQAKIIVIMRNPTIRLYSDSMYFRSSRNKRDFHAYVLQSLQVWRRCLASSSERQCVYNATIVHSARTRLHLGLYAIFLQDWFHIFPRTQIFLLQTERYSSDPQKYLQEIFKFLELDALEARQLASVAKRRNINIGHAKRKMGSMCLETRKLLDDFYKPYNQRLARLLQDDAYLWYSPSDSEDSKPCALGGP